MNTLTRKYKFSIFGEQYSFVGDEHDEHVDAAARLLDELMRDIAEKTHAIDTKRIAVLAALQLSSRVQEMEKQMNLCTKVHDALLERLCRLERDSLDY